MIFVGNYGSGGGYTQDVVGRANIVISLDNMLRDLKQKGKLEHFKRWVLIDDYTKSYAYFNGKTTPGPLRIEGSKAYLCLTDSVLINDALVKLWNITDFTISPSKQSGMWLFSLHVGLSSTRLKARPFPHGGYVNERPDSNLLWLKCEYGEIPHHWYQHERDGYYHQYTGLYLTTDNVLNAQKLLQEHCNLNTNITSHYVTPAIIRRYAGWD